MKEVTVYLCDDGQWFDNKEDAKRYDTILDKVNTIMRPLGGAVTEQFSARQQSVIPTLRALRKFMELCAKVFPNYKDTFYAVTIGSLSQSPVDGLLHDHCNTYPCLWKTCRRFLCISSETYIEYSHPYWANHEREYKKAYSEARKKMFASLETQDWNENSGQ